MSRPTPTGFEVAADDTRPGEPLYPKDGAIVTHTGYPVSSGHCIQVWYKDHDPDHGAATLTGKLVVIELHSPDTDGEDTDLYAAPAETVTGSPEHLFRIKRDLSQLLHGRVKDIPVYNTETGALESRREVVAPGTRWKKLTEARFHGRREEFSDNHNNL